MITPVNRLDALCDSIGDITRSGLPAWSLILSRFHEPLRALPLRGRPVFFIPAAISAFYLLLQGYKQNGYRSNTAEVVIAGTSVLPLLGVGGRHVAPYLFAVAGAVHANQEWYHRCGENKQDCGFGQPFLRGTAAVAMSLGALLGAFAPKRAQDSAILLGATVAMFAEIASTAFDSATINSAV